MVTMNCYYIEKTYVTMFNTSLVPPDSRTFYLYRESGLAPLTSINFLEGGQIQ